MALSLMFSPRTFASLALFNSTNEITATQEQLWLKRNVFLPYSQVLNSPAQDTLCTSILFHLSLVFLRHHPLLSYQTLKPHHSLQRSAPHTFLTAKWFSHTPLHMHEQCRQRGFAYLTERCRISVRDLLMLLAILISSFSSESVYWASWSRLRAQSALLASSSACTVCGKTRPRGSASR